MVRSDTRNLRESLIDTDRGWDSDEAESRTLRAEFKTVELVFRKSEENVKMAMSDAGSLQEKLMDAD